MWDIGSGINTLEVVEPDVGFLHSVIFSPDNRIIASGGGDGAIHRWDASSFQKVSPPLSVTSSIIDSVAFSPDGRLVLSGSRDSKIRVWDALFERDSVPTREGDHQWSSGLQFSPDGTCILHWGFKAICLYDAHTAAKVVSLIPHKRHFNLALFSPDSKRILSGSYDGSIQVWDTLSGLEVLAPRGHDGAIRYMRYAPDGMQFASTGRDNTF
jgi:WD40 repeat protein